MFEDERYQLRQRLCPKHDTNDIKFAVLKEIQSMSIEEIKELPHWDEVEHTLLHMKHKCLMRFASFSLQLRQVLKFYA